MLNQTIMRTKISLNPPFQRGSFFPPFEKVRSGGVY
jgi:hypothetical protein